MTTETRGYAVYAPFPMFHENDYGGMVSKLGDMIWLKGFDPSSAVPQFAHMKFISGVYVPWLISAIKAAADTRMNSIKIQPLGGASATGSISYNQELAIERATSIGNCVKRDFNIAKVQAGDKYLSSVTLMSKSGIAKADMTQAREFAQMQQALAEREYHAPLTGRQIEKSEWMYRAVFLEAHLTDTAAIIPGLDAKYPSYKCRQLYIAKMKKASVTIKEAPSFIKKHTPKIIWNLVGGYIELCLSVIQDQISGLISDFAAEGLDAGSVGSALIGFLISFEIPKSVDMAFEFMDYRKNTSVYVMHGIQNNISLSVLGCIASLAGILGGIKSEVKKTEETLKKVKEFGFVVSTIDKIIDEALKELRNMLQPSGILGRCLPDIEVRMAVRILDMVQGVGDKHTYIPTSEWGGFKFKAPGYHVMSGFGGWANVCTKGIGYNSYINLDFGGLLKWGAFGYAATVDMHTGVSAHNSVLGFGVARGLLRYVGRTPADAAA